MAYYSKGHLRKRAEMHRKRLGKAGDTEALAHGKYLRMRAEGAHVPARLTTSQIGTRVTQGLLTGGHTHGSRSVTSRPKG